MEKQSIIKALERARDEIANALNLINSGVINPGPAATAAPASDDSFGDIWPEQPPAAAAEPTKAKRGRPAKVAPDSDPFADAMGETAPAQGGEDGGDFFSEPAAGPTEKDVNDALVAAVSRLVEKAKSAGKEMKKTEARDFVLSALEKKFGDKNPAKLKTKWAEIIAFFTPKN